MIAIKWSDYQKYGCPKCGCNSARSGNVSGRGTAFGTCRECKESFVVLSDEVTKSAFWYCTGKKDFQGKDIFEYPEVQKHPRNGIPCHQWVQPDPKPEYGEYWNSRGIGYDLSGFVKSKKAGERLLKMVKEVLGKDKPESWLDWREYEPEWIQFKFQGSEFDLERLDKLATGNSNILTKEILIECKI